jgi:hypothetical protein
VRIVAGSSAKPEVIARIPRITSGMVCRLYTAGYKRRREGASHGTAHERGEVMVRKKFSRKQLLHFTVNLQVELIGMEACGGAPHLK